MRMVRAPQASGHTRRRPRKIAQPTSPWLGRLWSLFLSVPTRRSGWRRVRGCSRGTLSWEWTLTASPALPSTVIGLRCVFLRGTAPLHGAGTWTVHCIHVSTSMCTHTASGAQTDHCIHVFTQHEHTHGTDVASLPARQQRAPATRAPAWHRCHQQRRR